MPPKREASEDSSPATSTTPSSSPAKKSKSSSSSTPTVNPSAVTENGKTARAIMAEMIFEAGIQSISKSQIQDVTGLTPSQQKDLLRKDKGSLRKAVMAAIATL